ncbi:MAG TPA: isocitrate lyase/phosphoenolpyruvate mutase family protein [Stellaceae bacterium]|nr:isocitrate lyase/phosphoenolpyruvate mutase family protein [Stellaceae bacterium]
MNRAEQAQKAEAFRALHRGRLLLLPNAWDALSARIFVEAGFEAIATTSGGVAWALGYRDGEEAPWDEVVAQTRRIARVVSGPVTADIEAGFGESPEAVMRSVGDIIEAGAVGINLEDGRLKGPAPIRPLEDAVARLEAAREAARRAAVPIVINARTDLYLRNIGEEGERFEEAVRRGKAYLAAGADCFYPIGLRDRPTIARLVGALGRIPINVNVRAGSPSVAELEALGVARASTATVVTLMAMEATRKIAVEMRESGRFDALAPSITHAAAQQMFAL